MPLKNPICKKCGELRLPSGICVACNRKRRTQRVEKALAKARSPIPWIEREKKARVLAKAEKERLKRIKNLKDNKWEDTQKRKYKRGRLLLALVLDWLRMFLECFEKDETGMYWMKPTMGEQIQVMLIAMEIVLPDTVPIFKTTPMGKDESDTDGLRHSLFTCMLTTARAVRVYERRITALRQSGSISPEAETQMLADLHRQAQQRFHFYPGEDLANPHQKT